MSVMGIASQDSGFHPKRRTMTILWGGRFQKAFDDVAKHMSYSLSVDNRLFVYDIQTNTAHAKALHRSGYLTQWECEQLVNTLASLQPPTGKEPDEDVHSYVERNVTELLGDLGKKLHTGKSRNDQVMTDVRLFLKEAIEALMEDIAQLRACLVSRAVGVLDIVIPGFTHFQPAQPVSLAHQLLAYYDQFSRDQDRMAQVLERVVICPLGSGALAGNNYGIDRQFVADCLGFKYVSTNSMDAVADRDFMLEFLSAASICMTHLSRFCEELVLWNSPLIKFVDIGDDFTTGSSLMPQKKNPDIAELIRGKSGRVLGHYVALTHIMKALPLTYNRDFQEDKIPLFDTVDTLAVCVRCFVKMFESLQFNQIGIQEALKKGYMLATDLADYLVAKGIPFRQAHDITGQLVLFASQSKKGLEELTISEFNNICDKIQEDVYEVFDYLVAVNKKDVEGGTAIDRVKKRLDEIIINLHFEQNQEK